MELIKHLDYAEYLNFAKKLNQHNLFHSLEWAKFRNASLWNYEFIGIEENEELIAAALVLTKPLPKFKSKFAHIPRGLITDYTNFENLEEITKVIARYLKTQNVFAFRIDPDIIRHEIDRQKNIVEGGQNNYQLIEKLIEIGYRHQGFQENFEGMFPRYTFRNYLQEKSLDEMYDELYYKTRTNISTAKSKGVEIRYSDVSEIDDFITLLREKANRDGILGQSKEYFENLLNIINSEHKNTARLVFTFLNTKKYLEQSKLILNEIQSEYDKLEEIKNEEEITAKRARKISNLQKNLEPKLIKARKEVQTSKEAFKKYPKGLKLTGSIYVIHENRAWFLFTGSSDKYRDTMPAYLNLWEMIKALKEEGVEFLDLFGASGDISQDSPYFGIYLFKNRFNGKFMEFIGEFDYVIDSKYYFLYNKIAPKFQTSKDSKILRFLLGLIRR